ncbi:MAG: ChaN family lipoprotein [Cyanobacteria bacterium P01_D01_bin.105]
MASKSRLWLWGSVVGLALAIPLWNVGNKALNFEAAAEKPVAEELVAEELAAEESLDSDASRQTLAQSDGIGLKATDNDSVLTAIAPSQVIYLAETHSDPADHQAQLEIIQALSAAGEVAIGLEMFQRPFQEALDAYLAGEIDEAALIIASEYETRWGFDWNFYAPILRYAKENKIPLLALNTPAEITRKVARTGLESLEGDDLRYIPPVSDIDLSDQAYRDWIASVFNAHGGAGHSLNFDNFFAAQVLWDETMAERVVEQLAEQPESQVIVLTGEGHVLNDYGIPDRVERRLPAIVQSSVQLVPDEQSANADAVDFVWVTGGQ